MYYSLIMIKRLLFVFIGLLILTDFVRAQENNMQQNRTTIHVKAPFDKKNGRYIAKYCDRSSQSMALFMSKNGEAYLYWVIALPSGEYGWDSVSVMADTIVINTMKKTITTSIIDSLKLHVIDGACNYIIAIRENGEKKDFAGIDITTVQDNMYYADKVKPLVNCLENEYYKHISTK